MNSKFLNFFMALGISGSLILGVTSCSDDEVKLPAIGGFNTADEVAATNLVAYWPLDGNGIEKKSGTAPSKSTNASFVTGAKGQGLKLTEGFLDYPSITAVDITTGSITISTWAKISNTKLTPTSDSHISPIFSISGGANDVGNLAIFGNTHGLVSNDSIQLKAQFLFDKGDGTDFGGDCVNVTKKEDWMDATHTVAANKIGGVWAHIVYVYDGTTANNRLYANGEKISNSAWESRNNGNPLPMKFFKPNRPIIGATQTVANGTNSQVWNKALTGEVDEIRVFNRTLTAAEISSLYQLEKAGR